MRLGFGSMNSERRGSVRQDGPPLDDEVRAREGADQLDLAGLHSA